MDRNIVGGRRQSAADAYLLPVLHRPNLTVVTDATAQRVRVAAGDAAPAWSTGWAARSHGGVPGEVVLTAGTVGSAQLLMQSGIGPRSHLREVGVEVLLDLPGVGTNLQDHPRSMVAPAPARPIPATVSGHGEVIGLIRSDPALEAPDLQIQVLGIPH